MDFLTNEKLTLVGAAGMIGSNMAQTAALLRLTPNLCLYDTYAPGLEGVAQEMYDCGFNGMHITWTTDLKEALTGASYIISSGGAARKPGMTREDLLKGNAEIAAQLGNAVKSYAPDVKQVVIIFNPADITGLVFLIHAGIDPKRVSTLAALDSTRLRAALAHHFNLSEDAITDCRTYGGHGEQMAVFSSLAKVEGTPLSELLDTPKLTQAQWANILENVIQGGKRIMELRGRSSFQSPAYLSVEMIAAAMGGKPFPWPVGCYVNDKDFDHIFMAMETQLSPAGVTYQVPQGTPEEYGELLKSYAHLTQLRDEVIAAGIIPPVAQWKTMNPYL